jgi:G:T-mismatch repair DNA endonuclease (very short patch repair protein)
MSDVFTKAKRSEVMSRIRSRGNRDTELALVNAVAVCQNRMQPQ